MLRRSVAADMIDDFVSRLHAQQGDNLLQVVVYGSVARGDDHAGSDIELFILLRRDDESARLAILSLCADVSFEHSFYECGAIRLSPFIISLDDYRAESRGSLFYHCVRDGGVDLWL